MEPSFHLEPTVSLLGSTQPGVESSEGQGPRTLPLGYKYGGGVGAHRDPRPSVGQHGPRGLGCRAVWEDSDGYR